MLEMRKRQSETGQDPRRQRGPGQDFDGFAGPHWFCSWFAALRLQAKKKSQNLDRLEDADARKNHGSRKKSNESIDVFRGQLGNYGGDEELLGAQKRKREAKCDSTQPARQHKFTLVRNLG
jgi:hypothetical protein